MIILVRAEIKQALLVIEWPPLHRVRLWECLSFCLRFLWISNNGFLIISALPTFSTPFTVIATYPFCIRDRTSSLSFALLFGFMQIMILWIGWTGSNFSSAARATPAKLEVFVSGMKSINFRSIWFWIFWWRNQHTS